VGDCLGAAVLRLRLEWGSSREPWPERGGWWKEALEKYRSKSNSAKPARMGAILPPQRRLEIIKTFYGEGLAFALGGAFWVVGWGFVWGGVSRKVDKPSHVKHTSPGGAKDSLGVIFLK